MVRHTHRFDSFGEVEKWYAATAPMRGPANAGKDIRPIWDRTRKYERIVKISDDCYAISDGYHFGDALFPSWRLPHQLNPALHFNYNMEAWAPIVWRRYGMGIETVTIRNGVGNGTHTSRYGFLERYLPYELRFRTSGGRQTISLHGTPIYLAKANHLPPEVIAYYDTNPAGGRPTYLRTCTGTTDTTSLTFRKEGGSWSLASHEGGAPEVPRTVVDKEAKAAMKAEIRAFCDWALTVTPMINIGDYQVRAVYTTQFIEWRQQTHPHLPGHGNWGPMTRRVPASIIRGMVTDAEHPMRLMLAVQMVYETEIYRTRIETAEDVTRVRATMNRWINRTLGFNKKV